MLAVRAAQDMHKFLKFNVRVAAPARAAACVSCSCSNVCVCKRRAGSFGSAGGSAEIAHHACGRAQRIEWSSCWLCVRLLHKFEANWWLVTLRAAPFVCCVCVCMRVLEVSTHTHAWLNHPRPPSPENQHIIFANMLSFVFVCSSVRRLRWG